MTKWGDMLRLNLRENQKILILYRLVIDMTSHLPSVNAKVLWRVTVAYPEIIRHIELIAAT